MLQQLKNNQNGQNFVEYVVMAVTVIVGIIFFLGPSGPFRGAMERSLDYALVDQIDNMRQNTVFNIQGRTYWNSF
ncbi:MAG: hypothetical protein A3D10_09180 [Omnitrophica WOR_2 bacterium RIFCSPHIGHO2_02_FULL_48_11]|nr:MAG: hypothetical protein A3D10_09180 [Omnitrophica WOR_2 bacterium RIFCSPHIGHO2_02_FULL_48_11]